MEIVCLQCHSSAWTDDHFQNLDEVIHSYNTLYYDPTKQQLDGLYASGVLSQERYFDEEIEWQFYELWHHEGRQARMGAAMMAPDYSWWHAFYELKHRFAGFRKRARTLEKQGSASPDFDFPCRVPRGQQ